MKPFLFVFFSLVSYLLQAQTIKGEYLMVQTDPSQIKALKESHAIDSARIVFHKMSVWWVQSSLTPEALSRAARTQCWPNTRITLRNNPLCATPDDPMYSQQWNLTRIQADKAWCFTQGGTTANGDTITVGIVDAGADIQHEDLQDNLFFNRQEIPNNHIDDDHNGYIDDYHGWNDRFLNDNQPRNDHGTAVAGIIGAVGNNHIGLSGINQHCKLLFSTFTDITQAEALACYDYLLTMRELYNTSNGHRGAFIVAVNSSFGVDDGHPADYPLWCAVYDSMGVAGILNIGATANVDTNVDVFGDIPTACPSDYLIAVTASTINDFKVADAGWGSVSIDLTAPGTAMQALHSYNYYAPFDGTSSAAPQVSGAVALLYSLPLKVFADSVKAHPQATALIVKQAILAGVDQFPNMQGKIRSGGRLNLYNSCRWLANHYGVPPDFMVSGVGANPAQDSLSLFTQIATPGNYELAAFDMMGRRVASRNVYIDRIGAYSFSQDFTALATGMYIIGVRNDNEWHYFKWIK